jgi:hypothetical protein
MSGGKWDYIQYRFTDIAEDVDKLVEQNGKPKTAEELKESFYDDEWYKQYPEDLNHYEYKKEVLKQFKKAIKAIKIAEIYIQRTDWLLSGDDGEESFLNRLNEDFNKLKQ